MNELPLAILNRCSKGLSIKEAIEEHNKTASDPYDPEAVPEVKESTTINALGLPIGAPSGRVELKKALVENKVQFHLKAKTPVLVDLYRSEVLGESSE